MNTTELREHSKPLRYFVPPEEIPDPKRYRAQRIRIAILTSFRDLVSEGVGKKHPMRGFDDYYVKGTLEHALTESVRGKLAHCIEIAMIINDDTPRDFAKLETPHPMKPERDHSWFFPTDLRNRDGDLFTSLTRNIASDFRLLPLGDKKGREEAKERFEKRIRYTMDIEKIDVLVSDHFLCRIEHLIDDKCYDLKNKVLNTHPGISDRRHKFRTPGAQTYEQVLKRANGKIEERHLRTGASFHLIDEEFDGGHVVFDAERTQVRPDDDWKTLCARNYRDSKNFVFTEGLLHYAHSMYPRLNSIAFDALVPYETDHPLY